jgi:hypothetical protein
MPASCFTVNVAVFGDHESDNIPQYATIQLKEENLISVTDHKTKMM